MVVGSRNGHIMVYFAILVLVLYVVTNVYQLSLFSATAHNSLARSPLCGDMSKICGLKPKQTFTV